MADKSRIEWTDATWSPTVGCSVVSPGCTNCYAMRLAARLERMGGKAGAKYAGLTTRSKAGAVWNGTVRLDEEALLLPLRWARPRRIFVDAMSDLFHEALPDEAIDQVFAVMAWMKGHTFQVLTKRAARMREYVTARDRVWKVFGAIRAAIDDEFYENARFADDETPFPWPLPNVWIGVSVEDQKHAAARIPELLRTPAALRFVSCEPLLGPLYVEEFLWPQCIASREEHVEHHGGGMWCDERRIDWVIVGGESGKDARPMHPAWVRSLRDQCAAAGTPFFFKQWGEWVPMLEPPRGWRDAYFWPAADDGTFPAEVSYLVGKKRAGRLLDGVLHDEAPR